jgi:hypothetical protein
VAPGLFYRPRLARAPVPSNSSLWYLIFERASARTTASRRTIAASIRAACGTPAAREAGAHEIVVSVSVRVKTVGCAEAIEDDRPRSRRPGGPDHKMLQFEAAPDGALVSQFPHCDGKCRFVALVEQTNQSRPFKLVGTFS